MNIVSARKEYSEELKDESVIISIRGVEAKVYVLINKIAGAGDCQFKSVKPAPIKPNILLVACVDVQFPLHEKGIVLNQLSHHSIGGNYLLQYMTSKNATYDLKVSEQFDHLNGGSWFELFEIESGEVLHSGSIESECIWEYNLLDQNKYNLLVN